jgi:hypothetical protein
MTFLRAKDFIGKSSMCRCHSRSEQIQMPALGYFAYNFIKIHRTLGTSPAMAAGVTDRLWDVSDLVAPWEAEEPRLERAA